MSVTQAHTKAIVKTVKQTDCLQDVYKHNDLIVKHCGGVMIWRCCILSEHQNSTFSISKFSVTVVNSKTNRKSSCEE